MDTRPGDVVIIHHKQAAVAYARVEDIEADVKPGWWQLTLLVLAFPSSRVTWILREEYIDGQEFTMGGEAMRLQRLPGPRAASLPDPIDPEPDPDDSGADAGGGGKVLSLAGRRKGGK